MKKLLLKKLLFLVLSLPAILKGMEIKPTPSIPDPNGICWLEKLPADVQDLIASYLFDPFTETDEELQEVIHHLPLSHYRGGTEYKNGYIQSKKENFKKALKRTKKYTFSLENNKKLFLQEKANNTSPLELFSISDQTSEFDNFVTSWGHLIVATLVRSCEKQEPKCIYSYNIRTKDCKIFNFNTTLEHLNEEQKIISAYAVSHYGKTGAFATQEAVYLFDFDTANSTLLHTTKGVKELLFNTQGTKLGIGYQQESDQENEIVQLPSDKKEPQKNLPLYFREKGIKKKLEYGKAIPPMPSFQEKHIPTAEDLD